MMAVVLSLGILMYGCSESRRGVSMNASDAAAAENRIVEPPQHFGELLVVMPPWFDKPGVQKVADYIYEQTGVMIRNVYADQSGKFGLLMAAGKPVDSVMLSKDAFADALHKGMLQPIDEWMDKYGENLKSNINPGLWNWTKGKDGKTYGIPSESILTPYVPMIRADWLEAVHMPLPRTIDEFERAMIAIKKANPSRNDSKGELYPIFVELNGVDQAMLGAFLKNGISWWRSQDGTYLPPEMDPDYKEYLRTLQRWYKAKLIYPETYVMTADGDVTRLKQFIAQDLVGATLGWYGRDNGTYEQLNELAPGYRYDPVSLAGKYDNGLAQIIQPTSIMVLAATSNHGAGFVRLLDWIAASRENTIISRRGLPGIMYEYTDRANYTIKLLNNNDPKLEFKGGTYEFLDIAHKPYSEVVDTPYFSYMNSLIQKIASFPSYVPLDYKTAYNEASSDYSSTYKAVLDRAKKEEFMRIVTGEKPVSAWDDFLEIWGKMGMDEVIRQKNEYYKSVGN